MGRIPSWVPDGWAPFQPCRLGPFAVPLGAWSVRSYLVHGTAERFTINKVCEEFISCEAQCKCQGLLQGNLGELRSLVLCK